MLMPRTPSVLRILLPAVLIAFAGLTIIGCNNSGNPSANGSEVRLQGAGATFPNPLYQVWFSEYNKVHPNAKFDYQSIGSGGGIKQITSNTVDFAGSDATMSDQQLKDAPGELLHIPSVMGAVVLTYNIPSLANASLKFSGETIAAIYLGNIKKWNDPKVVADNPGVNLPSGEITVVSRSEGSGTTFVFTDYLSKVSPEWKDKVGSGASVKWPVGVSFKGNEGVTGQVKSTPNSIGYVELIYAEENKLAYADVKNAAGQFVKPSIQTVTNAAAGAAATVPPDLRVSITNAPGADSYPISTFTYFLVYKDQKDQAKGKALVDFLWWATHDGQKMAAEKIYAPLPTDIVQRDEEKIKSITFQGSPLYKS
jgi:phosphate transport system substrate-binding protein